jgi:3',5'-cyclic AMP phosphodiesterase CpdA
MHAGAAPTSIQISAPASARRPGPWEGRGGGPYVVGDEAGEPPMHPPGVAPGPYTVPTAAPLTELEDPGATWRFAAIGDYGAGTPAQAKVAASLLARDPDLLLTLGDNTYNFGLEYEYRRKWDKPEYFGRIREQIPVFPSLGNHDVRLSTRAYFRRFPELDRARYYAFRRGGVEFVALDSNQSLQPGSEQYEWLAGTLRDAQDAAFRVVYMHHPLLSSQNRGDGRLLEDLGPLLERAKVDLVLNGHEHLYERTKPINAYGTIEVTHGGGGNEIHPFETSPAPWSAARRADFGFLEFDVTPDALIGRNILADGSVGDEFRVPRGGAAAAEMGASRIAA